jgi:two-component sensor histidine kinase
MQYDFSASATSRGLQPPEKADPSHGAWLLLAEVNHRVANDYAMAVSSISMSARHAVPEAQADLLAARDRLYDFAEAHRALLAPAGDVADLSDYLAQLCLAVVRAKLAERGVSLRFIAAPFEMPSDACWRVGLIVSELITNALKHGLTGAGGAITVELRASGSGLDCAVRDNGCADALAPPGRGTPIIDAIAKQLDGHITRCFGRSGSCVVLSLPAASSA